MHAVDTNDRADIEEVQLLDELKELSEGFAFGVIDEDSSGRLDNSFVLSLCDSHMRNSRDAGNLTF